ncbi:MAG: ATP-binding cassette domain-containing protein [Desulfurococcaceae archaeon]
MDEIVVVDNLVKKFKDVIAVNKVSFKIRRGEVFSLLGPNGAGKTTTIYIISTLLKPTSGHVMVNGFNVAKEPDKVRKEIGLVFQDPSLDLNLTVYDNMYIHGRLYGLRGYELDRKITELLEFVDLKDYMHKQVRYLSGGMKRRLEVARGLLHEPELLILDEPTIGLDPHSRAKIWDYIRYLRKKRDLTLLLTTHYMDEAEELSTRVAIMDYGRIIAHGNVDELRSLVGEDVILVTGRSNLSKLCDNLLDVKSCNLIGPNRVEILVSDAPKLLPEIIRKADEHRLEILEISYRRPSLNEVFLHLTGRELRDVLDSQPNLLMGHRIFR